jgi:hypothetical protein
MPLEGTPERLEIDLIIRRRMLGLSPDDPRWLQQAAANSNLEDLPLAA